MNVERASYDTDWNERWLWWWCPTDGAKFGGEHVVKSWSRVQHRLGQRVDLCQRYISKIELEPWQLQLRTAKHNNLDILWSRIFGDKLTSDSDSARQNTSKNISPKFFPCVFRVANFFRQFFATWCTPLRSVRQLFWHLWLEFGREMTDLVFAKFPCYWLNQIDTNLNLSS